MKHMACGLGVDASRQISRPEKLIWGENRPLVNVYSQVSLNIFAVAITELVVIDCQDPVRAPRMEGSQGPDSWVINRSFDPSG